MSERGPCVHSFLSVGETCGVAKGTRRKEGVAVRLGKVATVMCPKAGCARQTQVGCVEKRVRANCNQAAASILWHTRHSLSYTDTLVAFQAASRRELLLQTD